MSRLTRGIFGKKPTTPGSSDVTSLDTQYVASVSGNWPSSTNSTEFIAAEAFYTGPGFISYKKLNDGLYYPGLYIDYAPSSNYVINGVGSFSNVRSLSVAPGGTHVAAAIVTAINYERVDLFIWKKAAAGYTSPWQYLSVLTNSNSAEGPYAVEFHPSGNYLAWGLWANTGTSSQKLFIYSRSGDTFTQLSNPTDVANSGSIYAMDWNPDGTSLAVAFSASPYIAIYNFSAGTLTKLSTPSTIPSSSPYGVKWNHDGSSLLVYTNTVTTIYNRSGNTFTAISGLPTMFGSGAGYGGGQVSWNNTGTLVAGIGNGGTLVAFSRSGDTFTQLSLPTPFNNSLTGGTGYRQAVFNPSGTELLVGAVSFIEILQVNGTSITRGTTSPFGAYVGPSQSDSQTYNSAMMGTTYGVGSYLSRAPTEMLRWIRPA